MAFTTSHAKPELNTERHLKTGSTRWPALGVISAGGALGALARHIVLIAWPYSPPEFPWAVLVINTIGCLLIGALMVAVTHSWISRPLMRPFFGVGVLGGFTTFSTYTLDIQQLLTAGHTILAIIYLGTTLCAAFVGVLIGERITIGFFTLMRGRRLYKKQS